MGDLDGRLATLEKQVEGLSAKVATLDKVWTATKIGGPIITVALLLFFKIEWQKLPELAKEAARKEVSDSASREAKRSVEELQRDAKLAADDISRSRQRVDSAVGRLPDLARLEIAVGDSAASCGSLQNKTFTIPFGRRFSAAPVVVATPYYLAGGSDPQDTTFRVTVVAKSETGFTLSAGRNCGNASVPYGFSWIAVRSAR